MLGSAAISVEMLPFEPASPENGDQGAAGSGLPCLAVDEECAECATGSGKEEPPLTSTCSVGFQALAAAQTALRATTPAPSSAPTRKRVYDGRTRAYVADLSKKSKPSVKAKASVKVKDMVSRASCFCGRRNCYTAFSPTELRASLEQFVQGFENLDNAHQNLVFNIAAGGGRCHAVHRWELLDRPISVVCLARLLGINKRRLYKGIRGERDARCGPHPRAVTKTADVDLFMLSVYGELGETMPDKFVRRGARLHGKALKSELLDDESDDSSDDDFVPGVTQRLKDLDADLMHWYSFTAGAARTMSVVQSTGGLDVSKMAKRRLPPGNVSGLYANYLLYSGVKSRPSTLGESDVICVSSESEEDADGHIQLDRPSAASWSCFYNRWKTHWSLVLEFGHKSTHATCDECCNYKHEMKGWLNSLQSDVENEVFENMVKYQRHLAAVAADRSFINGLRMAASIQQTSSTSQTLGGEYLLVIVDGMDQAKWRLPRFPELRTPKSAAHLNRPTVVVEAVWVVGHRLDFYLLDKDQHHDSNSIQECIAQSLEKVAASYESKKSKMPRSIILVADNTVRESKNQFMFKYWITHIIKNKFDLCLQLHMRAGHTHDVLGQPTGPKSRVLPCSEHSP